MSGPAGVRVGVRCGVTLLEILVVVGVLAVLAGVLLPVLSSVRGSAQRVQSLSNVRTLGVLIETYTASNDGVYPALEDGVFYPGTGGVYGQTSFSFPYWQVATAWTGVTFEALPYDSSSERVYVSPGSSRLGGLGVAWPTSYHYSTSFAGQPGLWSGSAGADVALRRPVRTTRVGSPSAKVLLWDIEVGWRSDRAYTATGDLLVETPMAFADGSGSERVPAGASEAVENPFVHAFGRARLHNTRGGVKGRDY